MSKKPIIESMKRVGEMVAAGVAVEERGKIVDAAAKGGRFMMESFVKGHNERTDMLTGQGGSFSPSSGVGKGKVSGPSLEK